MPVTRTQVKYIQSLGQKKFRDAEGVFLVEGPKITGELLAASGLRPRQVYALQEWIDRCPPEARKGPIIPVGPAELERLSGMTTPNQVVAVFEKPVFGKPDLGTGIHLVLDGIQDPGNLGTIVRLADWFGIGTVIATADSADVFNPKAVQSTMGSIARVRVLYGDPVEMIGRERGMAVYATVLDGEDLYGAGRIAGGFIVIGNESRGVGAGLLALATRRVTIPRIGQAESLNAAVAAGIVLSRLVGAGAR